MLSIRPDILKEFGDLFNSRVQAALEKITEKWGPEQERLLAARETYEAKVVANPETVDFLPPETLLWDIAGTTLSAEAIRTKPWKVSETIPIPAELRDKPGLQLTGPAVQMNMLINGLNSNAVHYMIDFEDAQADKQLKLYQALRNVSDVLSGKVKEFKKPGKTYTLKDPSQWTQIIFRHRGPHLVSRQITFQDRPVPAAIADIVVLALNFYGPLKKLHKGLYFYSPKIQTWQEALWLDSIFRAVEKELEISENSLKLFVLHERVEHSFQQEEIMWVLRKRFIGPNVGRWDYLSSDIYLTHQDPDHVYPDPHTILMTAPHMDFYSRRNAAIAVKHGAIPIGGMAAQLKNPLRPDLDSVAVGAIRNDKTREWKQGYDYSWTATIDPEYVDAGNEALRQQRESAHPVEYSPVEYTRQTRDKFLELPPGARTSLGVFVAIHYAVRYMFSQQNGENAAAIEDPVSGIRFMNDFATYEIFWHWLWTMVHHQVRMEDGPADYRDKTLALPFLKVPLVTFAGKQMNLAVFNEMLAAYQGYVLANEFKANKTTFHASLWPSVFELMQRQIASPKLVNYGSLTLLELVDEENQAKRQQIIDRFFGNKSAV